MDDGNPVPKPFNRSMFSNLLYEKMKERLEKKEQIMLFLNRRGYAGFITCRSCGYMRKESFHNRPFFWWYPYPSEGPLLWETWS